MTPFYVDEQGAWYGLGLIPSPETAKRRVSGVWSGSAIPRSEWRAVDYRPFAPTVFNQGSQGSCVGHGGVGVLCTLRALHGHGRERLSPSNLYGQINGGRDRGALVADALEGLRTVGVCLESTCGPGQWPRSGWPATWKDEARRFRIEKADEVTGFDQIATAVLEGDPVCFGIELGLNFEPDGRAVIPDRRGEGGGHCMFALGLEQIDGRWHLLVQNSWGTRWGAGGYCYLPESYLRDWHEAWRLQAATDDPRGESPPAAKE
jgi:Papain family cysteine protease